MAGEAQRVLEEMLRTMRVEAQVKQSQPLVPSSGVTAVTLDIRGDDLGILIGRRGETLSALQMITNLIVGRRTHEWARLVVDVEGYRLRREETLRNLALRMADRVRYSRTPFTMEAMPPNERRIVHLTLQDNPYVTTESHGEGDDRKVTVSPRR